MSFVLSDTILAILVVVITGEENTSTAGKNGTTTTNEVDTAIIGNTLAATKKTESFAQMSTFLLLAMSAALLFTGCVVVIYLWLLAKTKRGEPSPEDDDEVRRAPSPQMMESQVINLSEFHDLGPLVMQARMKGRIKHALDDDKSYSLKEVKFDPKHNEIVMIGSDIEQFDGMSQLSMLSCEKSKEAVKAPKRGAFPTMASGVKTAEAAIKEAQRVAENERMIAICAARRRTRDSAAASSRSEETKSGMISPDLSKVDKLKSERKSSMIAQRTQASLMGQAKEIETSRRGASQIKEVEPSKKGASISSAVYPSSNDAKSSKSSKRMASVDNVRRSQSSPQFRRKLTHDGRMKDGLGVRYDTARSCSSTSLRPAKTLSTPSHLLESGVDVHFSHSSPPLHQ